MRRTLALAAAGAAAAGLTALPADGATKTIRVVDDRFRPAKTTVRRGTTVRFVWAGKHPHNITVFGGPTKFTSKTQTKGTYRKRLRKRGTYRITCTVHSGMNLRLRVR